jgi:DNA polymerase-3 subunit chi
MTRVDFYHDAPDRLAIAAGIVRKAYAQHTPLLVFIPQAALAARFDQMLWEQPATGFLPHCRADSPLAGQTTVLIATELDAEAPLPHDQLLINLGQDIPPGFARFLRVIEIVGRSEEDKTPARSRFKFYRDHGYEINRHDLSGH